MHFKTFDIWRGIYSSHQRCLEAVNRLGLTLTDDGAALPKDAYQRLLQYRLKTAKGEKKEEIQRRLAELNGGVMAKTRSSVKAEAYIPAPITPSDSTGKPAFIEVIEYIADWATSKAIVFLTLIGALAIQVHHVAQLVNNISPNDSLLIGYVFGSVSELTALMLTVHRARKSMLIVFAVIQCWINVLYYCELPDLTVKLTLSALIAFVICSYFFIYQRSIQRLSTSALSSTTTRLAGLTRASVSSFCRAYTQSSRPIPRAPSSKSSHSSSWRMR